MVLNFENDLKQKCVHHASYDLYQHIFCFSHHRCYNDFILRVGQMYYFCPLNNNGISNEHFLLMPIPYLVFVGAFKIFLFCNLKVNRFCDKQA